MYLYLYLSKFLQLYVITASSLWNIVYFLLFVFMLFYDFILISAYFLHF